MLEYVSLQTEPLVCVTNLGNILMTYKQWPGWAKTVKDYYIIITLSHCHTVSLIQSANTILEIWQKLSNAAFSTNYTARYD